MIDRIVTRLIDYQMSRGFIEENDRKLYQYGYQILFEYIINVLAAVLIAAIFRAYGIVIVFTLTFMLVRSYVGGYHAKSGARCFVMSAVMQILVILAVRVMETVDLCSGIFIIIEIFMLPYIFRKIPLPVPNKPISENERIYFRKKAKVIYASELVISLCFIGIDKMQYAYSILCAHLIIFVLVIINNVHQYK